MSIFAIAATGLLSGLWPFQVHQVQTRAYTLPTWSYSQSRDRFTGKLECRVYEGATATRPPVVYAHRAVTFRFPARINTLQADYRFDGGPVRPWRDAFPALAEIGLAVDQGGMDNPTGGLVSLPARELAGVHTVTIRPRPDARPQVFTIDGLSDAIEAARSRGCGATAFGG